MLQTLPGWVSWPLTFIIMGRATHLLIRFLRRMDTRDATTAVRARPPEPFRTTHRGPVIDVEARPR